MERIKTPSVLRLISAEHFSLSTGPFDNPKHYRFIGFTMAFKQECS